MAAPEIPVTLDSLIRAVEASAPDDRLTQLAHASATASQLGDLGDSLLGVFVDRCRHDGRSWSEIGGALGVTKQAVQKRFVSPGMLNMTFERYTDRARRVVAHAAEESRALRQNYRGTEHLLLALFDEPEGIAARVLVELGATKELVRSALLEIVPEGETPVEGDPPFTPRSVRVMELTLSSALELGHNYIGTEHILIALLREGEGLAAQIMRRLGLARSRVETRIREMLAGYQST